MKKALLVTIDFPPKLGGVAKYYENICKNLPADKIVVLTNKAKGSDKFDKKQQYKIYREDLFFRFFWPRWVKMILKIKKIIKKENIEIIYIGQILPVGEAMMLVKLPFIVFTHGMDITMPQKNKRKALILKKIIGKSYKLISNSNFTKNELRKLGAPDDKITIINPCPDTDLLNQINSDTTNELVNKYNLKDNKIILSVGRLVERKDFDKVIESLTLVSNDFENYKYIIVGDGNDKNNLESTINRLNLDDRVILTGDVNDQELAGLYNLCDVFVMTPKQLQNGDVEGFGTVYLEANLFGKPVISTRSGGVTDAVVDNVNGLLIYKASINEISDAIIKLLKDRVLSEKLGKQGKNRVQEEFLWYKQIKKLLEI